MQKINNEKLKLSMLYLIVSFCENAAELGCPREKDVDIWIRELALDNPKEAKKVMGKLLKIMKRNYARNVIS